MRGLEDFQIFVADAGLDEWRLGEPNAEWGASERDPFLGDGVSPKDWEIFDIAVVGLGRESRIDKGFLTVLEPNNSSDGFSCSVSSKLSASFDGVVFEEASAVRNLSMICHAISY